MMIIKFVSSLPKNNIFMFRNVVLYYTYQKNNLFIKDNVDKNNKYFEEAVSRLQNVLIKN